LHCVETINASIFASEAERTENMSVAVASTGKGLAVVVAALA
jgi:hypothetical protein